MRTVRKVLASRRVAAVGGTTIALLLTGAVLASGSSTPIQVCISGKEGKPVLTPKGGVCKAGYTLHEVGAEGQPGERGPQGEPGPPGEAGPAGTSVVDRVRLTQPFVTGSTFAPASLTGATWSQGAEEVQQLVGQIKVLVPSKSECDGVEGEPTFFTLQVKLDGRTLAETSLRNISSGLETVPLEWKRPSGAEGLVPAYWLAEPGTEAAHSLTVEGEDGCATLHTKHYVVESLSIAVIGAR